MLARYISDLFVVRNNVMCLRGTNKLVVPRKKTTNFGLKCTPFIGSKMWKCVTWLAWHDKNTSFPISVLLLLAHSIPVDVFCFVIYSDNTCLRYHSIILRDTSDLYPIILSEGPWVVHVRRIAPHGKECRKVKC